MTKKFFIFFNFVEIKMANISALACIIGLFYFVISSKFVLELVHYGLGLRNIDVGTIPDIPIGYHVFISIALVFFSGFLMHSKQPKQHEKYKIPKPKKND